MLTLTRVTTIIYAALASVAALYIDPLKVGSAVAGITVAASFLAKLTKDGTWYDSVLIGLAINPAKP